MFEQNTTYDNYVAKLTEENQRYQESVKDVQWVWLECNHKLVKCQPAYLIDRKSFGETLYKDANQTVERIKTDHKKLFNWILNDFSGSLNKADKKLYSFSYHGDILSDAFVSKISAILKETGFENDRYDKRDLKNKIDAYLDELNDGEDDPLRNRKVIGDWNEIQVEFLFKLDKFLNKL